MLRALWQLSRAPLTSFGTGMCGLIPWPQAAAEVGYGFLPHLASICLLNGLVQALNWRSRHGRHRSARQEEVVLVCLNAIAIAGILARLTPENRDDYTFASFLIICGPSVLKVRWWLAMVAMAVPTATALVRTLLKGILDCFGHVTGQEEVVLVCLNAIAVDGILAPLTPENWDAYRFASFLITCGLSVLKVRWWLAILEVVGPTSIVVVRLWSPS
jgi:hypothetical protein